MTPVRLKCLIKPSLFDGLHGQNDMSCERIQNNSLRAIKVLLHHSVVMYASESSGFTRKAEWCKTLRQSFDPAVDYRKKYRSHHRPSQLGTGPFDSSNWTRSESFNGSRKHKAVFCTCAALAVLCSTYLVEKQLKEIHKLLGSWPLRWIALQTFFKNSIQFVDYCV